MKPTNKRRSVRLLIVGLAAVTALAVSGVAVALSGTTTIHSVSGPTSINTCTKVTKSGALGKTKVTPNATCSGTQIFQQWTMAPADSDQVYGGFDDNSRNSSNPLPAHMSAYVVVDSLTIQATGHYVLTGKAETQFQTPGSAGAMGCFLTNTQTGDQDFDFYSMPTTSDPSTTPNGAISLMVTPNAQITAGQKVQLQCENSGASVGEIYAVKLAALQVTGVTNGAIGP